MLTPVTQGSKVGIITPSAALNGPEDIRNGLRYLQQTLGFEVVLGNYVYENFHNMGGTPRQRAEDVMRFFADPEIKAVFATRGGFGAQYILPELDYDIIGRNPKPIIGFSDITALQTGIFAKTGNISYAGPLLGFDFATHTIHPQTAASLQQILQGNAADICSGQRLRSGRATGTLLGTNLCVLMHLCGTPYFPDLRNSILLLEDVDEKSYRIERMLLWLQQQQGFSGVRGIIFGQFTNCGQNSPHDRDVNTLLTDFAADFNIPMIKNFAFGHVAARYVLPLGAKVQMDADACRLQFIA